MAVHVTNNGYLCTPRSMTRGVDIFRLIIMRHDPPPLEIQDLIGYNIDLGIVRVTLSCLFEYIFDLVVLFLDLMTAPISRLYSYWAKNPFLK